MPTTVWSYGGGIQSAAIGILIHEGVLRKPDLAVIADTGREKQTTWDYLANVMQPYLAEVGVTIQIAPHSLARVDLYATDGGVLVPAYTKEGRLGAYCSGEWKRDVCERWMRLQGVNEAISWIGYSTDEARRVKKDHRPWCHLAYPLIEKKMSRTLCIALIQATGLPVPQKSRCWGCPHQNEEEWRQVKESTDWDKAVALDEEIRANDPTGEWLYLYSGRVPLAMADLSQPGLVAPAKPCDGESCWT